MRNTVSPIVSRMPLISSSNAAAPIGSRPAVGSSRNSRSGSSASARARPARLRIPPDSSFGNFGPARPGSPTIAILYPAISSIKAWSRVKNSRIGASMFSATVSDENSAPPWNSTPQRRRRSLAAATSSVATVDPSTSISPPSGVCRPMIERIRTDLPVPDPPTTPMISPRRTSRLTSLWTTWLPKLFCRWLTRMTISASVSAGRVVAIRRSRAR